MIAIRIEFFISDDSNQNQQPNPVSQGDELNYVIPSYQIQQPTVDLEFPDSADSSSSIQIPFHPQEEQQLIWMDDNIPQQQKQGKRILEILQISSMNR